MTLKSLVMHAYSGRLFVYKFQCQISRHVCASSTTVICRIIGFCGTRPRAYVRISDQVFSTDLRVRKVGGPFRLDADPCMWYPRGIRSNLYTLLNEETKKASRESSLREAQRRLFRAIGGERSNNFAVNKRHQRQSNESCSLAVSILRI